MSIITRHLQIEGRVQGVGFRWSLHAEAVALGLDGWVRNRGDSSVELVAAGADDFVKRLIEDCRRGPPSARVTAVEVGEESEAPPSGFQRRPTE